MSDPRFLRASRVIASLQAPVVVPQARRLRRSTPHLPAAPQPWPGELAGHDPLRLLVLGDSTAAGVGVETQLDGLPGRLAIAINQRLDRGIAWRAVGENGATTRDLLERFVGEAFAEPFDLMFLSIGANDALGVRSAAAYARDLRRILNLAMLAQPDATVLVSSLPVFGRFELLPEPLRGALFRHSRNLERAGRAVTVSDPRWIMSTQPPPYADGFFAGDEFHPSAIGYRDWADWAVSDAWDRGLNRIEGASA
jgi:lysophospholipase L1-like esterase